MKQQRHTSFSPSNWQSSRRAVKAPWRLACGEMGTITHSWQGLEWVQHVCRAIQQHLSKYIRMPLAFNPKPPFLGIPKESIRHVYDGTCLEIFFLVQLSITRKFTDLPNNSGLVKQIAIYLYCVTIHVIQVCWTWENSHYSYIVYLNEKEACRSGTHCYAIQF